MKTFKQHVKEARKVADAGTSFEMSVNVVLPGIGDPRRLANQQEADAKNKLVALAHKHGSANKALQATTIKDQISMNFLFYDGDAAMNFLKDVNKLTQKLLGKKTEKPIATFGPVRARR